MELVEYNRLLTYLRTGSLPSLLTKNERDSLRIKAKNFIANGGLLFYRDKKKTADLQASTEKYFPLSLTYFIIHPVRLLLRT